MRFNRFVTDLRTPRLELGSLLLAIAALVLTAPTIVLAQGTASDAAYQAALNLQKGVGVKADPAAAAAEFQRLADAGHVAAACQFAQAAYRGAGIARSTRLADQYAEKGATDGSGACLAILGDAYQVGRTGYKKSAATAFERYMKAATAGNTDGMYEVGEAYRLGEGVNKDSELAVQWLEKAVGREHTQSITSLGAEYLFSQKIVRRADGLKLLRVAAEKKDLQAQVWLGEALAFGEDGVEPNPEEGQKWLKIAADSSSNRGIMGMARIYRDGVGAPKDWAQAVQWAEKAQLKNHAPAATFIGRLYAEGGPNLPKNLRKGYDYLKLAYGSGDHNALDDLNKITGYMSTNDLVRLADSYFYAMAYTDYFGMKLGSDAKFNYSSTDRLYYVGDAKLIVHVERQKSGDMTMTIQASNVDILKPFYKNFVLGRLNKLSDLDSWLTIRTQVLD